jgi:hypothetical protein
MDIPNIASVSLVDAYCVRTLSQIENMREAHSPRWARRRRAVRDTWHRCFHHHLLCARMSSAAEPVLGKAMRGPVVARNAATGSALDLSGASTRKENCTACGGPSGRRACGSMLGAGLGGWRSAASS